MYEKALHTVTNSGERSRSRGVLPDGEAMLMSLYQEERANLLRIIKAMPCCPAGMEEDVLHEAVERLLFKAGKEGSPWQSLDHCRNSILRTARNLAIDHRRREASRVRVYLHEAEIHGGAGRSPEGAEIGPCYEGLAEDPCSEGDPEERILREEERAVLRDLLNSLDDKDMMLLVSRELEGLPWEEIAREVGTDAGTLRVRYSRVRARLRRDLVTRGA